MQDELILVIRKYRVRVILFVVFLVIFFVLFNFTLLDIKTSGDKSVFIQKNSSSATTQKRARRGVNIVRKGETIVTAVSKTNPKEQSTGFTKAKILKVNNYSIETTPQKQLVKTLSETEGCVVGSFAQLSEGDGFSYNCISGGVLYKHSFNNRSQKAEAPSQIELLVSAPYLSGVVGFGYLDGGDNESEGGTQVQLVYTDGNTVKSLLSNTKNIFSDAKDLEIQPLETGFVVINSKLKILMYFKNTNTVNPVIYYFSNDISSKDTDFISSSAYKNTVVLSVANKAGENDEDFSGGVLWFYDFSQSSGPKKESIAISKKTNLADITMIDEVNLFKVDIRGALSVYKIFDKKIKLVTQFYNVDSAKVINGTLYYLSKNSIYKYLPEQQYAELLYESANLQLNNLESYSGGLVINGYSPNTSTNQSSYLISDLNKTSSPQLVDKLPYSLKDLPLLNTDFVGNKLYFRLDIRSLRVDYNTNNASYDKQEFESKKQQVLRRLKLDGLDLSKLEVIFTY